MWLVRLALRNLTRNLRRSMLSGVSVVAGTAVLILGQGFIGGLDENIIRGAVDTTSGHVLIRPVDYPDAGLVHPVDELFTVSSELAAALSEDGSWTERTLFVARAVHGGDSLRVRAIGFDPQTDATVFPRTNWRVRGEEPTDTEGVLLSQGVAQLLEIDVGDTFMLQARTPAGAINAMEVEVRGVFTAGNPVLDSLSLFVPDPLVDDLMRTGESVSHVALRLDRRDDATAVAAELRPLAPEQEVVTWVDETAEMLRLQDIRRTALSIIVLALMGMSATGIMNTILMAAYERIREVGTLRAMGMTKATVVRMFLFEGAVIGIVGGLFGVLIGGFITAWFSRVGIDLSSAANASGMAISTMLYTQFQPDVLALAFGFGFAVSVAASWYPGRVAAGMQPADAVRADT